MTNLLEEIKQLSLKTQIAVAEARKRELEKVRDLLWNEYSTAGRNGSVFKVYGQVVDQIVCVQREISHHSRQLHGRDVNAF